MEEWGGGGGFKPNGIKFIMFLKMSMFYIRGIIILARQRNNLRDTIMKSRDYMRRARRVEEDWRPWVGGGDAEVHGVSVSEEIVSMEGAKKKKLKKKSENK